MGKLLTGRYGHLPEAESVLPITLSDCNQKLGLKPSDFVSEGAPDFFRKSYGTKDRYLVFQLDADEVKGSPIWQVGYYLLPVGAASVIQALEQNRRAFAEGASWNATALPVRAEMDKTPPAGVQDRLDAWIAQSQPLFFHCGCQYLELKVVAPWGLRRRWKARLRCPKRCQPPLTTLL